MDDTNTFIYQRVGVYTLRKWSAAIRDLADQSHSVLGGRTQRELRRVANEIDMEAEKED